jgi:hypothetical protein
MAARFVVMDDIRLRAPAGWPEHVIAIASATTPSGPAACRSRRPAAIDSRETRMVELA